MKATVWIWICAVRICRFIQYRISESIYFHEFHAKWCNQKPNFTVKNLKGAKFNHDASIGTQVD